MPLYKYVTPDDAIRVLATHRIRFTPPEMFNDPFECRPHFDRIAEPERLAEFIAEGVSLARETGWAEMPSWLRPHVSPETYADLANRFEPVVRDTLLEHQQVIVSGLMQVAVGALRQAIGVLSLTENRDSLLMWAHYAKNHEGVVLGFDDTHEYFHQKKSAQDDLRHLRKVEYRQLRPNIAVSELTEIEVYLVKSLEWNYEHEWRIARPLAEANSVETTPCGQVHLFDFPPSCLRSVILGCRSSEGNRSRIRQLLQAPAHYSHVEVYTARPHDTQFRLEILSDDQFRAR